MTRKLPSKQQASSVKSTFCLKKVFFFTEIEKTTKFHTEKAMLKYCPWRSYKFILKHCDFWISLHAVKIKMTKSTTTKTASKWFGNENFSMDVRIISCIAVMLSREFFAQSYCLTAIFVVVVLIWFLHFFFIHFVYSCRLLVSSIFWKNIREKKKHNSFLHLLHILND